MGWTRCSIMEIRKEFIDKAESEGTTEPAPAEQKSLAQQPSRSAPFPVTDKPIPSGPRL